MYLIFFHSLRKAKASIMILKPALIEKTFLRKNVVMKPYKSNTILLQVLKRALQIYKKSYRGNVMKCRIKK